VMHLPAVGPSRMCAAAAPLAAAFISKRSVRRSGFRFTTESCPTSNKNQPENHGFPCALFDYDSDGNPDVYSFNGCAIPSLRKESENQEPAVRNNGISRSRRYGIALGGGPRGYGMGLR